MKNLLIAIIFSFIVFAILGANSASAESVTSCLNPTGTTKVSYPGGEHTIAGETTPRTGSDTVYTLDADNLMQCFCAENGDGVQTDWIRISGMSDEDIKVKKSQGYIYVPNGTAWGLDDAPYLAKNTDFACKSKDSGSSNNNSSSSSSNNNSSSSNNNSSSPVGQVLALASTGNMLFIVLVFVAAVASYTLGMFLRRSK